MNTLVHGTRPGCRHPELLQGMRVPEGELPAASAPLQLCQVPQAVHTRLNPLQQPKVGHSLTCISLTATKLR